MIPGGLEPEGTRPEGPVRSSSRPDEWSVGQTGGSLYGNVVTR